MTPNHREIPHRWEWPRAHIRVFARLFVCITNGQVLRGGNWCRAVSSISSSMHLRNKDGKTEIRMLCLLGATNVTVSVAGRGGMFCAGLGLGRAVHAEQYVGF